MAGNFVVDITGVFEAEAGFKNVQMAVYEKLHDEADQLGEELVPLVQDKTPVDTGALVSSITYFPLSGQEILEVYAASGPQMAQWSRYYVYYQEGPPLGLATYTNGPRQMFLQTAEGDGLAATESWGMLVVMQAIAETIF